MATQLANSDSLNDLNIETIFQLEEQTASLEQKLYLSAETVRSLTAQKGEALGQLKSLQDKMAAQTEQLTNKDQEISDLNHHITDIKGMLQRTDRLVDNQKDTIMKLESRIDASQQELADLTSHTKKLEAEITTGAGEARLAQIKSASGSNPHTAPPIMSKEKHTLAAGIANRLLNDLRRELAHTQEEKADLLKKIVSEGRDFAQNNLPQSTKCDAAELYHQIWRHTEPLNSIMQYHRVCGGLNLLLSNIPVLKPGCFLDFSQIEGIWNQADAAAKDTLAFMWCLNELKLPVGVMETISASPPFYIKRYVLRCVKMLNQHHSGVPAPREPFPTLKSYSHGQYHSVRDFQRSHPQCFDQALANLATADTSVCYEAVQHYQTLINKHPGEALQPTLSHLKSFVTKTMDEQHTTLTSRRFGTITSNTLLLKPKDHTIENKIARESIGTCFL